MLLLRSNFSNPYSLLAGSKACCSMERKWLVSNPGSLGYKAAALSSVLSRIAKRIYILQRIAGAARIERSTSPGFGMKTTIRSERQMIYIKTCIFYWMFKLSHLVLIFKNSIKDSWLLLAFLEVFWKHSNSILGGFGSIICVQQIVQ